MCLTETVQPAIIGIDVLPPAPGEAHGHKATQREQAAQPEDPHVFAGSASGRERREGQTDPGASGSGEAVLQCGALRRTTAAATDASRSGLANGLCHPSCTQARASSGFQRFEAALWLLGIRLACVCQNSTCFLDFRPSGCGAGPNPAPPPLSPPHPPLCAPA